jgi:serine/threonine-protein kinase
MGLATGNILGDWRIEKQIGQGGMGTVFSAVHQEIGKRAAIKVIRPGRVADDLHAADRFLQEARVVNQIQHPNIVDIFHLGRLDDGAPYLVMELLEGESLGDRLERGRVPALEAIDVLLQVCAALTAAHRSGVVHRDLKPDNIFLVNAGGMTVVKLVDWGIAKLLEPPADAPDVTGAGTMVGTPRYIAPEQARGLEVDERTDVYSLGCIAHELFLESPPFTADNVADLLVAHLKESIALPSEVWPDIPDVLEQLLLSMLDKDAAARPTLAEITDALEETRNQLESGRVGPLARGSGPVIAPTLAPRDPTPVPRRDPTPPMVQVVGTEATMMAEVPAGQRRRTAWSGLIAGTLALVCAVVFAQLLGNREALGVNLPRQPASVPVVAAPVEAAGAVMPASVESQPVEIAPPAPVAKKAPPTPKHQQRNPAPPIDPDATIDAFQ